MNTFTPQKPLLNPKFEGYKLDLIPQDEAVTRFTLQYKPTQAAVTGKVPLSFHEVQSRITHNHLVVKADGSQAIYVDEEYKVILVDLDADILSPSFRIVHELPTPLQSDSAITLQREYPSAAYLNEESILVADGHGSMYIFAITENSPSVAIGTYTLSIGSIETPFRIHHVHRMSATTALAVLSSRCYPANPPARAPGKHTPIDFDIWAARIDLLSFSASGGAAREMDILWHRRGTEVPIYMTFVESLNSHLLIGGCPYPDPNLPLEPSYEPSSDELAPIPRAGESLDTDMQVDQPAKPLPYSWTQISDSVTVAFPLPSNTQKNKIRVSFSPCTLTLHVENDAPTSVPIPRYSAKTLWGEISTSSSFWTWDREAELSYGLLTLHIEKRYKGTRWMQVFAAASTQPASQTNPEDVEIPETLDPSELWLIRENLEKYTAALRTGEDASGLGLGRGIPSLAEGEMDEDVDASVGRTAYLTWVEADGSTPSWSKNDRDFPFQLLSTPIPGIGDPSLSLIVKSNVDGTVFTLNPLKISEGPPKWIHTDTFSALAFVLASKQDTRFTYHIPKTAVLAFEGGVQDRGGNVYIYHSSPIKEKWAKQAILKVDDGRGGSLLGVGAVKSPEGKPIVICLTEGELVLIETI